MRLAEVKEEVKCNMRYGKSNYIEAIKNQIRRNPYGRLLINYKRIICQRVGILFIDDETCIRRMYKKKTGRKLNLENPKRFTEKLQWLKLYYRNPMMSTCADKVEIRRYLKEKGYEKYLVPIVGVYSDVREIEYSNLPDECILKATHGSSMHILKKRSMKKCSWITKKIMQSWLFMNIYPEGREWPYKNIRPRIICEELLCPKSSQLRDFKFFCFSGIPKFVQVDSDLLNNHKIDFFDENFERLPLKCQYSNSKGDIIKPDRFDEMKQIAANLSKEFPHVRVDFYVYDNEVKIGEMTFFDGSGFYSFVPDEYDYIFGQELQLIEYKGKNKCK